jgi:O-glycosyl hydrolase
MNSKILIVFTLFFLTTACAPAVDSPAQTAQPTHTPTPTFAATRTPAPTITPTPPVASISIDPAVTYQTLDGFGANTWTFPYASDLEWDWEAVKFVFDELDLAYLRLAPWLGWWETANDNADPFTLNMAGFGTVYDIINTHDLPFAQYVSQKGIELSVGVWDFAAQNEWCETCTDWLARGDPRSIPPELYPELGETIAAYILNMQANGVTIAYAEVQNEPDIQAGVQYTNPQALRAAGRVVLQMLDHYGLPDVPLHAPNLHSPRSNLPWIEAWFEDETLRQRSAAVSYHTWWSEYPQDYEEIWLAAQKYGKPVWATEAGYSGSATSINPQNWLTAFGFAESYYRAIAWSHASRVYHWSLLGYDGAVGKQGERYPMFYAIKHFANSIPPGAVLLDSRSDDTRLKTLAFRLLDGGYTLIVLNANRAERAFTLQGLEVEITSAVTSSDGAYEVTLSPAASGDLTVPALSITSIRLQDK